MGDRPLSALEEMIQEVLSALAKTPDQVVDRSWCHGVLDLLLVMHPDVAYPWLRRVKATLVSHAAQHRCGAPLVFQECYEERLASLQVR